jgi:hypothetical protein
MKRWSHQMQDAVLHSAKQLCHVVCDVCCLLQLWRVLSGPLPRCSSCCCLWQPTCTHDCLTSLAVNLACLLQAKTPGAAAGMPVRVYDTSSNTLATLNPSGTPPIARGGHSVSRHPFQSGVLLH